MRKTVRIGCFETNSSSLHSLIVARGNRVIPDYMKKSPVVITGGEFGWEYETYKDPVSKLEYVYTGLTSLAGDNPATPEEIKYAHILDKVKEALATVGVDVEWSSSESGYYPTGYIDHVYELRDFLDYLGESDDNILDFIFDEYSSIATGNDNGDEPASLPAPEDSVEFLKSN